MATASSAGRRSTAGAGTPGAGTAGAGTAGASTPPGAGTARKKPRSTLHMNAARLLWLAALTVLLVGCSELSLQSLLSGASNPSLIPSSAELSAGESVELTVEGGIPPYEFEVDKGAGNTLEVAEDSATFTLGDSPPPGVDTWNVTVTDSQDQTSTSTLHRGSK